MDSGLCSGPVRMRREVRTRGLVRHRSHGALPGVRLTPQTPRRQADAFVSSADAGMVVPKKIPNAIRAVQASFMPHLTY